MNEKNLEALKVWYALFTVIMDDQNSNVLFKFAKLRALRERIAKEAPELDQAVRP